MQVSAEIRWFWRTTPPAGFEDWFNRAESHPYAAGGGKPRIDKYLHDSNSAELGIKHRGGKGGVEVKGLIATLKSVPTGRPFAGPIELWCKWTSQVLDLSDLSMVTTEKRRWSRKFDTGKSLPMELQLNEDENLCEDKLQLPERGCNVELTQVKLPLGAIWWTLGFEAFGTIETVGHDLCAVAATFAARQPPEFAEGQRASYPAWLMKHAKTG
jgi:hypothetical protein